MVSERPMVLFRGAKRMHTDRGPLGPFFFGVNVNWKL
jgi:hypothetical protein